MALRPADAVANDFFRARRFIGSGDRRAVSDRVWRVLRTVGAWAGGWAIAQRPACWSPRRCCWRAGSYARLREAFSGGRFAPAPPAPLRAGDRCTAWKAARWTIRRCPTRCGWKCRTGCCRIASTPSRTARPAGTRVARSARQPAEGHARGGPRRARRRGPGRHADAATPRGACASRAAARSPPAPRSAPGWWRSRTRAASWSPPWSMRGRACASPTCVPAPAARRWRWR